MGPEVDLGNPAADHPLNRGLVAWWLAQRHTAGGFTLFDLAVAQGRNHGTLTAGPLWVGGPDAGPAVRFDGTDDYVDCGTGAALGITGALTLAVWVRMGATGAAQQLLCKDADSGGRSYNLDYNGGFRFYVNGGGGGTIATSGVTATVGVWYHVAGTYLPSTTLAVYVNGVQRATGTPPASVNTSTTSVKLGRRVFAGNNDFLNGTIRDASVHARCLSASEVMALYQDALAGYPLRLRRTPGVPAVLPPPPPPPASAYLPAFSPGFGGW